MDERPACALCMHSCDDRWIGDGTRAFCTNCLKAVGRFVSSGLHRERLWPALNGEPVDQTVLAERSDNANSDNAFFAETFVDFTKGLERVAASADAETHLDLGMAYGEMGLVGDALMEAARALRLEHHLSRTRAREALGLLFNRRHLRVDLDATLVELRQVLFAN